MAVEDARIEGRFPQLSGSGRREIVIAMIADPITGQMVRSQRQPKGYEQIVEPATATALTPPAGAFLASIQNNGSQPARWRDDGPNPTATMGQRIEAGDMFVYQGDLNTFRIIREAAGVTLDVSYYA